jgi:hypothetical protein
VTKHLCTRKQVLLHYKASTFALVKQAPWRMQRPRKSRARRFCTSIAIKATFVLVKQAPWRMQRPQKSRARRFCTSKASKAMFVLVKQAPWRMQRPRKSRARRLHTRWPTGTQLLRCKYLYFCTSKASKLSTRKSRARRLHPRWPTVRASTSVFVLLY